MCTLREYRLSKNIQIIFKYFKSYHIRKHVLHISNQSQLVSFKEMYIDSIYKNNFITTKTFNDEMKQLFPTIEDILLAKWLFVRDPENRISTLESE